MVKSWGLGINSTNLNAVHEPRVQWNKPSESCVWGILEAPRNIWRSFGNLPRLVCSKTTGPRYQKWWFVEKNDKLFRVWRFGISNLSIYSNVTNLNFVHRISCKNCRLWLFSTIYGKQIRSPDGTSFFKSMPKNRVVKKLARELVWFIHRTNYSYSTSSYNEPPSICWCIPYRWASQDFVHQRYIPLIFGQGQLVI